MHQGVDIRIFVTDGEAIAQVYGYDCAAYDGLLRQFLLEKADFAVEDDVALKSFTVHGQRGLEPCKYSNDEKYGRLAYWIGARLSPEEKTRIITVVVEVLEIPEGA